MPDGELSIDALSGEGQAFVEELHDELLELALTDGVHEGFAELLEQSFTNYVIKAPIVLGLDVDISVAEEEMLLELSYRV